MRTRTGFTAAGIVLLTLGAAQAQSVATDANGRTLYTFDQDLSLIHI